jgi:hypothetical protein
VPSDDWLEMDGRGGMRGYTAGRSGARNGTPTRHETASAPADFRHRAPRLTRIRRSGAHRTTRRCSPVRSLWSYSTLPAICPTMRIRRYRLSIVKIRDRDLRESRIYIALIQRD